MRFKIPPRLFGSIASVSIVVGFALSAGLSDAASRRAALPESNVAALFGRRTLPEPLVPTTSEVSGEDCRTLIRTLDSFERRARSDDFSHLETYLQANPKSPWRLAVWTNLGLLQYSAGYFSRCITSFYSAWEAGKDATEPKAKALADRAAGEYAKMLARVGRYPELKAFLGEVEGRQFIGQATELILAGVEGAKIMETRPEVAFRCGPLALSRILASKKSPLWTASAIVDSKSTMQGISLAEVAEISKEVELNYQPAKRTPGAAVVVPSVIHWKAGHYAALIKQVGNRYLTQDPTFEGETWHTLEALEAEASGYFLVPPGPLARGWSAIADDEARQIRGKGQTSGPDPNPKPPEPEIPPPPPPDEPPCPGMASYSFRAMLASLQLTDTPVGYRPPYGMPIYFTATYIQRDPNQPSNFNYSNLGPKWSFNWTSYIVDDPGNPAVASRYAAGTFVQYSYSGSSGGYHNFATQINTNQQLRRPTAGLPYEVTNPDGSKEIYGQSNGSTVAPRKVFLTQLIDPSGNITALTYDAQLRLARITDALGQQTVFSYELAGDPYKITKVTDPFGRFATFQYDSSRRLVKIRDVIGLESAFSYDGTGDFVTSLATSYGTTTFSSTQNGATRRLTATDPAGDTEVLENVHAIAEGVPFSEAVAPQGFTQAGQFNQYLYYRNSFHWNKKQWKEAPEDYTKAHIYHWLHAENFSQTSPCLESEKAPLQSRIWYAYPGQTRFIAVGTGMTPIAIGRAVEGGSQITRRSLNHLNLVTSETDPLGRITRYEYEMNGLDVKSVSQQIAGVATPLASYTYNNQHRPLTYTDAAGQVTTHTWTPTGQIAAVKNAKNETTTFSYYAADATGKQRKGRLEKIDGALAGSADIVTFDYDAAGNVAKVTGPDGYDLDFSYDALDRLTRTTFPDGTYTETAFDRLDPLTSRDRLGRLTHFTHNSIRQLTSVTDPAQRKIRYDYCDCGDMDHLIDAMDRITRWRHDIAGRVTAKVYADGSTIKYAYEPLSGRLATITDEKAQVKTRTYNLDNTLAGISYTNEEHETPDVAFTYETDFRRLRTMVDGIGTTIYAYHPIAPGTLGAGRLASVDAPLPNDTLTYAYDEIGRNTGYAINGIGETRSFDPLGRLLSAANPLGNFGYTYVGATSRMDKVTYPNGMTCDYDYHPLAGDFRLKDIIHTLPGNTLLSRHSYAYNAVGNITRWTQISPQAGLNRSWLCGYDDADQLTSVTSQDPDTLANLPTGQYGYTYDSAGNRLTEIIDGVTVTANSNALNQLISLTTAGASPVPQQTYEWDAENRLIAVNHPGSERRSEFLFDGYGRRVRVTEKDGSSVTSDLQYISEGLQLSEERNSTGAIVQQRYFVRGMQTSESGGPLLERMFTRDHLGSVRGWVSSALALTNAWDFDPWGRRSVSVGQSTRSGLSFTGYWLHEPTNLLMAPYRVFNPTIARWLSRDTIGEAGGVNLYGYVDSNPVGMIDPLGFDPQQSGYVSPFSPYVRLHPIAGYDPHQTIRVMTGLDGGPLGGKPGIFGKAGKINWMRTLGMAGVSGNLDIYYQTRNAPAPRGEGPPRPSGPIPNQMGGAPAPKEAWPEPYDPNNPNWPTPPPNSCPPWPPIPPGIPPPPPGPPPWWDL